MSNFMVDLIQVKVYLVLFLFLKEGQLFDIRQLNLNKRDCDPTIWKKLFLGGIGNLLTD